MIGSPLNDPKKLQSQFSKATRDQEIIQKRYEDLWSWYGTKSYTLQFLDYKMEGTLRKFVEEVKIFQRSVYPKRFFTIDFSIASIVVSKILYNDKCVMTNPENTDKSS